MTSEAPANLVDSYANIRRDPLVRDADGWTQATPYAQCQFEYAPHGTPLLRIAAGTSRASFDPTEAATWVPAQVAGRQPPDWGLTFTDAYRVDRVYLQGDVVRRAIITHANHREEANFVMRCPVLKAVDFEAELARHDWVSVPDFKRNIYPPPFQANPCADGSAQAALATTSHAGENLTVAQVASLQALADALAATPPDTNYLVSKDAAGVVSFLPTDSVTPTNLWTFDTDFTAPTSTATAPEDGDLLTHVTNPGYGRWRRVSGSWALLTEPTVADFVALQTLDPVGRKLPTGTRIAVLDDRNTGAREYLCHGPSVGAPCTDVIPI